MKLLAGWVPILVLLFAIVLLGCAPDRDLGSGSAISTRDEWCALLLQPLPAMASPNPDGREIEVVEEYIERYGTLGSSSVVDPEWAKAAKAYTAEFEAIRRRVVDGEALSSVLRAVNSGEDSGLQARAVDLEAAIGNGCD